MSTRRTTGEREEEMPTKSYKTDGTAKKRWSATERTARGHAPRRGGGKPRGRTATAQRPAGDRRQPETISERTSRSDSARAADFKVLGLKPTLIDQLAQSGIDTPFPIQAATIPDAMAGRDILGRAQTGSGKTLAFGLPMITTLADSVRPSRNPRGLVLVPTRELAMQVTDVLAPLARTERLSVVLVAGGMSYTPQLRALQRGVDIVIATPGRLIDLLEQGAVDLGSIAVTVLDEADHMADLGFLPAVTQLLDAVPMDGQRLLFSATLDGAVDQLVSRYLSNPVVAQVDSDTASVTTMAHHVVHVGPRDKSRVTAEIASRPGRTVIFVRTQLGADRVAEQLRRVGVLAGSLHGGLAQGARTRILAAFRDGTLPALVATDVAARGIHVDDVGLVLQVDPPNGGKEYLHRAGRTARAGGAGQVVTLVLPHQRREVSRLLTGAGVRGTELPATMGNDQLTTVTGGRSASAAPVSEADYLRLIAPPARQDRSGPRRSTSRRRDHTIRAGGRPPGPRTSTLDSSGGRPPGPRTGKAIRGERLGF
jgi:superfamily II DNA/RNA helicase